MSIDKLAGIIGAIAIVSCLGCSDDPKKPSQPPLEDRADVWLESLELSPDSEAQKIGKTRELLITTVTSVEGVESLRSILVGDTIREVPIGAIRCKFHTKDSTYGGEQFMWRGRWGCMAGRSRQEIENAVAEDGTKRFSYIHVAPVSL